MAWHPDFTSFLIQVIARDKFCSVQEVSTRSIQRFHFEDALISRFYFVLSRQETVKTFSTNILIRVQCSFRYSKSFLTRFTWIIRNEAKHGDQDVFEMKSLDWACEKWSEIWSCYWRYAGNRIMSVYGLTRTAVMHLLQANSRLTPLRAHHKLLLVAPPFARVFITIC